LPAIPRFVLLAALVVPAFALADEVSPPSALVLTVDDAIDRALAGNFGLRLARHDVASAQSSLRGARNEFDFKLETAVSDNHAYFHRKPLDPFAPPPIARESYLDDGQTIDVSVVRNLEIGGSVALSTSLDRTVSHGAELDPLHSARTVATWRVPILQGRGRRVATAGVVTAETGLRQQARGLVEREMRLVADVARAFYQVQRSEKVLAIDKAAVARAEDDRHTYQLRLEEGLVTPIDVSRAERELKDRQNSVVTDEESLRAAGDRLMFALGLPIDTPFEVAGEPAYAVADVDLESAIDEARSQRADLRTQRENVELADLGADVAKDGTRPKVDLAVSAGMSSPLGEEASKWAQVDHDDWLGGLSFAYTFGERSDDEAYLRSRIAQDEAHIGLEELERQVVLDVRDAVRSVRSLERQVELLKDNVDLSRESLRLAKLQLEENLIRTTDLLQIQDELVRAETAQVNAVYDHAVARIELDLALGRYRVGTDRIASPFLQAKPSVVPDVPILPRERLSSAPEATP
jgi:outer membrane protein TolC